MQNFIRKNVLSFALFGGGGGGWYVGITVTRVACLSGFVWMICPELLNLL